MIDKNIKKKCIVEGCNSDSYVRGYCKRHYSQIIKHGHILNETRFDKNKYIVHDDYAEIIIKNSKLGICYVQIDLDDLERCKKYKWFIQYANGNYYRVCSHNKQNHTFKLHRYIMNMLDKSPKIEIDHIDGNPFNNRKSNLRLCSHSENQKNLKLSTNNKSGLKGVRYNSKTKKWEAEIWYNNQHIHIGKSKNKEDAIKMRSKKETELYKDFKRQ